MTVKVAINGFGRIGRLVLRAIVESERKDLEVVALNDLGSTEANAHLFHYDSVHGRFPGQLEVSGDTITIRYGGRVWGPIKVSAERDPTKVPYGGVDVAMECTGIFTSKDKGIAARVVSVPSLELFLAQPEETRRAVIGGAPIKVAVEAAVRFGWDAVIGPDGQFIGMASFGASAPYKDVYKNFGITPEAVADAVVQRHNA